MPSISGNTTLCMRIQNVWRNYSCKKITYVEETEGFSYVFTLTGLTTDIKLNSRVTGIEIWDVADRKVPSGPSYDIDGFIVNVVTSWKSGEAESFVSLQVAPGYKIKTPSYNSKPSEERETNVTTSLGPDTSQYSMNIQDKISREILDNKLSPFDPVTGGYKVPESFNKFLEESKPKEKTKTELLAINIRRSIKIDP